MESQYVFEGKEFYKSCHAVTICQLPNKDLIAAWFAGTNEFEEGEPDQVIMGSTFNKESGKWGASRVWVNVPSKAAGNPRLFVTPNKVIWLIAPINYGEWCEGGTRLFYKCSYDLGCNWTDLALLIDEAGILGKNKPIITKDASWIIPAEQEKTWEACFLKSEDEGKTWSIVGKNISGGMNCIQPTVVQLSNGDLLAYMRTRGEDAIAETYSNDNGSTWSKAKLTSLPNNNSGIDMVRLYSGNLVLVCNKIKFKKVRRPGLGWGLRTPLNVLLSANEGQTWEHEIVLEDKPGEYSYPSVIQSDEGTIHIVYSCNRTKIKHVMLSENELIDN